MKKYMIIVYGSDEGDSYFITSSFFDEYDDAVMNGNFTNTNQKDTGVSCEV